jgi:hypothetical protein
MKWLLLAALWFTGPIMVRVENGPMVVGDMIALTAVGPVVTIGILIIGANKALKSRI